uniref:Uncharacterized protein n=1 Tax=Glossina austeni TaxID=7395 RepID=A0A1A9VDC4_GLOAU
MAKEVVSTLTKIRHLSWLLKTQWRTLSFYEGIVGCQETKRVGGPPRLTPDNCDTSSPIGFTDSRPDGDNTERPLDELKCMLDRRAHSTPPIVRPGKQRTPPPRRIAEGSSRNKINSRGPVRCTSDSVSIGDDVRLFSMGDIQAEFLCSLENFERKGKMQQAEQRIDSISFSNFDDAQVPEAFCCML